MSYFSDALADAIESTGYNLQDLAAAADISSHGTISRLRSGELKCSDTNLSGLLRAFAGHPQQQLNLIVGRCKDMVPAEHRPLFDQLYSTSAEESPGIYRAQSGRWEKALEKIREKGLHNEDLRRTVLFLSEVAT